MRSRILLPVTVAALAACSNGADLPMAVESPNLDVSVAASAHVTNGADTGPGSFRQAVVDASFNPAVSVIVVAPGVGRIALGSSIIYTGSQSLRIIGAGATLDGSALGAGESALVVSSGANLYVRSLGLENAPGTGLTVAIPDAATGTIDVTLDDVTVRRNGSHGILINDQKEYFTDPNSSSDEGSMASLSVRVLRSTFADNGLGALDNDGLRVNEGGIGSIDALVVDSRFTGNGADGLELDERFDGDARFRAIGTWFNGNGAFDVVTDPDDGIDVDEAGNGDIVGYFEQVQANGNSEQGVDLNENDAGDLRVDMNTVTANDNPEEGIEFEEDDDFAGGGHLIARLTGITTLRNGAADGDAGLKLREKGVGNLDARVNGANASDNLVAGVLFREDLDGSMIASIVSASTSNNAGDGVSFDENGVGDLSGVAISLTSDNNGGAGIKVDQQLAGNGLLRTRTYQGNGNAKGPITAANTTVVQQ